MIFLLSANQQNINVQDVGSIVLIMKKSYVKDVKRPLDEFARAYRI
jgi:hypothetical protein